MWTSVEDALPRLGFAERGYKAESEPVLVVTRWGSRTVATLEKWEDDEKAEWFAEGRDHYCLDDDVTHWQYMEEIPSKRI